MAVCFPIAFYYCIIFYHYFINISSHLAPFDIEIDVPKELIWQCFKYVF